MNQKSSYNILYNLEKYLKTLKSTSRRQSCNFSFIFSHFLSTFPVFFSLLHFCFIKSLERFLTKKKKKLSKKSKYRTIGDENKNIKLLLLHIRTKNRKKKK